MDCAIGTEGITLWETHDVTYLHIIGIRMCLRLGKLSRRVRCCGLNRTDMMCKLLGMVAMKFERHAVLGWSNYVFSWRQFRRFVF